VRRAIVLGLVACGAAPHAAPPPRVTPSEAAVVDVAEQAACPPTTAPIVVRVAHFSCDGRCPNYSVAVYRDGTVDYYGRVDVAVAGRRVTHVDPAVVDELARGFEAIGFGSLPNYDQPMMFGGATAVIEIGNATVTVTGGDRRIPPQLTDLEDKIDVLADVARGREQARGDEECRVPPTVLRARIVAVSVDGGVVRMVVAAGEKDGITRAWKAQLLAMDTHEVLPGELTIAEIHEREVVVTMPGTAAPPTTRVRLCVGQACSAGAR